MTSLNTSTDLRSSFALRNFSSKCATSSQRAAFSCGYQEITLITLYYIIPHSMHDVQGNHSRFSRINSLLTNIMARAVLRSLRYLSRYFSFWFFRGPLFILVLCSEELAGDGKACAEGPVPELGMVCGEEPRKDWAVKACRACCRSSPLWEKTGGREVGRETEICSYVPGVPEASACVAFRVMDENETEVRKGHRWSLHLNGPKWWKTKCAQDLQI